MREPVMTWGKFVRSIISAVLAVAVVDVPAVTRSSAGHIALLFLVMATFRSLVDGAERVVRRLLSGRRIPEA